jgi:outer membrane lipoprotein carrier protein
MLAKLIFIYLFFAPLITAGIAAPKPHPQPTAKIPPKPAINNINLLADAIQKHYNQTNSATFDFTQNYKHPFLPTNESSKGEVFFKARNMLWRYKEPADRKKEFYIAGNKFTYYLISDKIAYTHNCFDQDTLSASITFLWGKGKIKDSFTISAYTGEVDPKSPLKWLTLTPKEKNAPVKHISLGADAKTGTVKESIVVDQGDGVNHFVFTNFKTNVSIAPHVFNFKAPPGLRVQPMPNIECPPPKAPLAPVSNPAKAPAKPTVKATKPAA